MCLYTWMYMNKSKLIWKMRINFWRKYKSLFVRLCFCDFSSSNQCILCWLLHRHHRHHSAIRAQCIPRPCSTAPPRRWVSSRVSGRVGTPPSACRRRWDASTDPQHWADTDAQAWMHLWCERSVWCGWEDDSLHDWGIAIDEKNHILKNEKKLLFCLMRSEFINNKEFKKENESNKRKEEEEEEKKEKYLK